MEKTALVRAIPLSAVREWLSCPACCAKEIAWDGCDEWEGVECYNCGEHFEVVQGRGLRDGAV